MLKSVYDPGRELELGGGIVQFMKESGQCSSAEYIDCRSADIDTELNLIRHFYTTTMFENILRAETQTYENVDGEDGDLIGGSRLSMSVNTYDPNDSDSPYDSFRISIKPWDKDFQSKETTLQIYAPNINADDSKKPEITIGMRGGIFGAIPYAEIPEDDGTYTLKLTIIDGEPTYQWILDAEG